MARTCLAAVLFSNAVQAASANFLFNSFKSMGCGFVKIPLICTGSGNAGSTQNQQSSSCNGGGCCASSSCYSLPMMGCSSSRGPANCVGGSMMTAGQCMCTSGSCSGGVCSGGSGSSSSSGGMMSDLSDLYEENDEHLRVLPEDHSRVAALYTGAASLLLVAGMSAGVRQARGWAASRQGQQQEQGEQAPQWELLEQASTSDEVMD